MITFKSTRTVAVGEAMIEMAETGGGSYRKSFAGDTFNTAWHIAQIADTALPVRFVTKVGTDPLSAAFIAGLAADGLDTAHRRGIDPRLGNNPCDTATLGAWAADLGSGICANARRNSLI